MALLGYFKTELPLAMIHDKHGIKYHMDKAAVEHGAKRGTSRGRLRENSFIKGWLANLTLHLLCTESLEAPPVAGESTAAITMFLRQPRVP